jgi:hypothetical protein
LALLAVSLSGIHARAQIGLDADAAALKKEQDILFQRVLRDPKNLDAAFRHAEVSTALASGRV